MVQMPNFSHMLIFRRNCIPRNNKATGKYIPINQWLWFDFFETTEELKEDIERNLTGTRYDDQIAIFGNELLKKLNKLNIFIVGAGAL